MVSGRPMKSVGQAVRLEFEACAEFEQPVAADVAGESRQVAEIHLGAGPRGVCIVDPTGAAVDFAARGDGVAQAGEDLRGEHPVAFGITHEFALHPGQAEAAAEVTVEVAGQGAFKLDVEGDRELFDFEVFVGIVVVGERAGDGVGLLGITDFVLESGVPAGDFPTGVGDADVGVVHRRIHFRQVSDGSSGEPRSDAGVCGRHDLFGGSSGECRGGNKQWEQE